MPPPDDGDRWESRPYGLRHRYRASQLWATHHADTDAGTDVRLVEAGALGDGTDIDTPEDLETIAR